MPTIRERSGKYHVMVRKAGHPTLTKTFTSKRKAQAWAAGMESRIEDGETFDTSKHTLADAIERYREDPARNLTTNQKTMLAWWETEARNSAGVLLGRKRLAKLKRADFIDARDLQLRKLQRHGRKPSKACQQGECDCPLLAPATIQRRVDAVSAVLTDAIEWDWIATNPARIKRMKEDNERDRLLTPKEQERLLKACKASDEPHLYAFVVTAMVSGARAGELQSLRWKDIDTEKGVGRVLKSKNGERRPIPIRGHALEVLSELRKASNVVDLHGDDFVFKSKTGYAPFFYRIAWGEARAAAGLDDVRFHDLRHLAASHFAMAGVSQRELMAVMGHKSPAMSKRYAHFFDSHIADLGDRINDRLFGKASD